MIFFGGGGGEGPGGAPLGPSSCHLLAQAVGRSPQLLESGGPWPDFRLARSLLFLPNLQNGFWGLRIELYSLKIHIRKP